MRKFLLVLLIFFFISGLFIQFFSSVSALELVGDSWTTKASMSQARANLGVVAVDGKIYAIGGYTAFNHELWGPYQAGFCGTNERYDPKADTWVTLAPMPTPRANFAIAAYQGEIYCIGGESLVKLGDYTVYRVVEVYDTVNDSWSVKNDVPFDGLGIQAQVVDRKIFAISQGQNLFMYDPVADKWIQKASMPIPGDAIGDPIYDFTFVMDSKIIVYFKYQYEFLLLKGQVMIYDTKNDVWSEGKASTTEGIYAKTNTGIYGISGDSITGSCMTTGVYAPKKVYAFGLAGGSGGPVLTNWVYDPVADIWSNIDNISTYRDQFGVAVIDDILYVIGGKDALGYDIFSYNEQYVPSGHNSGIPPVTATAIAEPSDASLRYFVMVILVLMVSIVVIISLFFYLKCGRKRIRRNECA